MANPMATLRDRGGGEELSVSRRWALLFVASIFVIGCFILTLVLRAVPKRELATVTCAVLYVLAANVLQPSPSHANIRANRIRPLADEGQLSRLTVRFFLTASLLLSLLVPWVWIVFFRPELKELQLLGPHLFLMMAQVLFEIWSYRSQVSIVIRIGIPVGFVSYRLRILWEWIQAALEGGDTMKDRVMLALAVLNFCFWGVILFYVLLLKVCPPYFLQKKEEKRRESIQR